MKLLQVKLMGPWQWITIYMAGSFCFSIYFVVMRLIRQAPDLAIFSEKILIFFVFGFINGFFDVMIPFSVLFICHILLGNRSSWWLFIFYIVSATLTRLLARVLHAADRSLSLSINGNEVFRWGAPTFYGYSYYTTLYLSHSIILFVVYFLIFRAASLVENAKPSDQYPEEEEEKNE